MPQVFQTDALRFAGGRLGLLRMLSSNYRGLPSQFVIARNGNDEAIQLNRQEDSENSTRSPRQPGGLPRNDNRVLFRIN